MKFLILFAVGALFVSVQCNCDNECFRAIFKECVKEPVPEDEMTLCGELKSQIECVSRLADKCKMEFRTLVDGVRVPVQVMCKTPVVQREFDKKRACYQRAVTDIGCAGPLNDAMSDLKTAHSSQLMRSYMRANKKVCRLFDPYAQCVKNYVDANCGDKSEIMFNFLFKPLHELSTSLCEKLILPADERDSRPDNFGNLNVFASIKEIFFSA